MVDLMSSSDPFGIPVIGLSEHFESLMDKDVMYEEVGKSVSENAQSDRKACPQII